MNIWNGGLEMEWIEATGVLQTTALLCYIWGNSCNYSIPSKGSTGSKFLIFLFFVGTSSTITMQRWNRKKAHFPLIVLFFLVFIAFSTFHSENSIPQIHENPDHVHNHLEASVEYVKPNLPAHLKQASGMVIINSLKLLWEERKKKFCF